MLTVQLKTFQTQTVWALKNWNAPIGSATDKKDEKQQDSAKVTLSDSGKRLFQIIQNLRSLGSASNARKSAARAHAAQLKQQIETLKKIAASLGPLAAKGILRQIKQIAQQIRSVAAELAQPSALEPGMGAGVVSATVGSGDLSVDESVNSGANEGGSVQEQTAAEETAVQQEDAGTEGVEEPDMEDKEAEQAAALVGAEADQAASEAEKEVRDKENDKEREQSKGVNGNADIASQRRARGEQEKKDVALMRDLVKNLRQLLAWVKSALLRKDKEDKDNLKEIDRQLQETEKLVRNMEASANIDISIGDINSATLSDVEASTVTVSAIDTAIPVAPISAFA